MFGVSITEAGELITLAALIYLLVVAIRHEHVVRRALRLSGRMLAMPIMLFLGAVLRHRLLRAAHTGRKRPHHHTSYGALTFLLLLLTVLLSAVSGISRGQVSPVEFSGTPPAVGATIATPVDAQSFTSSAIAIVGSCPPDTLVVTARNGQVAGSTICDGVGQFNLDVSLVAGVNRLTAQDYSASMQAGPVTSPVSVMYTPTASESGTLYLTTDQPGDISLATGDTLSWSAKLSGGKAPYAAHWDWGDGSVVPVMPAVDGSIKAVHRYRTPGIYQITVRAQDATHAMTLLQLGAKVNGQSGVLASSNSAKDASSSRTDRSAPGTTIAWPLLGIGFLMVISFYLGERAQLQRFRGYFRLAPRLPR